MDSLEQTEQRYHAALAEFVKGDPRPALQMFSLRDDVVLCNPLYPYAKGPDEVAKVTEQAAAHLADGTWEFEPVTSFGTAELAYIIEVERFRAIIDGTEVQALSGLRRSFASKKMAGGSRTDTRTR